MNPLLRLSFKIPPVVLILAALLCSSPQTEAKGAPFSKIVVFGDSLSDTGNLFRLSGGFPPSPYFEGRSCDGELWVEYLARAFGMEIQPGDNHAVFGATTGPFNLNNGLNGRDYPGLAQQIDTVLSQNPTGLDPNALYIVWAGANDLSFALETGGDLGAAIQNGVQNTVIAIQKLSAAGARHIMVPNMPDLGLTPASLLSGFAPFITQMTEAYNVALGEAFEVSGISIIELDTFKAFQGMVAYAQRLGFKNVTDAYLAEGTGKVRQYLFWDSVHPTTRAHQVLSVLAAYELNEHFTHGRGKGRFHFLRAVGQ